MNDWIIVHDADVSKKKFPSGRPVHLRTSLICYLRFYDDGRVRTVIGFPSGYLHVTEDREFFTRVLNSAEAQESETR